MQVGLLLLILPFSISQHIPKSRPNVILIMADDLGWGDISPNNPLVTYTPNLQKLAEAGMRYTDYHAAASVCTPSRAGLLTGRLGQRTGVIRNFSPRSVAGLPLTEHTLGNYMQHAGYKTGVVGKWHLGITPDYHPLSRGFDVYYGLPYSNDMGCVTCSPIYDKRFNCTCGEDMRWNVSVPLYENRNIIEQPVDLTTLSARYVTAAQTFMSGALSAGKPFFLYAPLTHVHTPLATSPENAGRSGFGPRGDAAMEMDGFVGAMIEWVKGKGLEENTIVMFTSDNGPAEQQCQFAGTTIPYMGMWQKTFGRGGSVGKFTTWEGGHRVPFIVSWPGTLPAGQVSEDLVSALDIVPTFADIANFTLPKKRVFDGVPMPFGTPQREERTLLHLSTGEEEIWAIRVGRYKVYYATATADDCSLHSGTGFQYHNPAIVFDLTVDPLESYPLVSVEAGLYERVEQELKSFRESVRHTFRSITNYNEDPSVIPCCNAYNPFCAC